MWLRNLTFLLVMSLIDSRIVENDTLLMRMESFNFSLHDLRQINGYSCNGIKPPDFCQNKRSSQNALPENIEHILNLVQQAAELCNQFFNDFHDIEDTSLVSNSYIAAGQQGMVRLNLHDLSMDYDMSGAYSDYGHPTCSYMFFKVFKCECNSNEINTSIVAQKLYYTTDDKNITEIALINEAVSDGGVRAPLYWFHDNGYFEEFLGHKKDLWFHPTGLALNDKIVWSKTAENFGLLHRISIPDIDQSKEGVSKNSFKSSIDSQAFCDSDGSIQSQWWIAQVTGTQDK